MRYQMNTTNYHDFHTYEVNKLPARSYFIPYPTKEEADGVSLQEKRYKSSKVECLNGTWDFHFYANPADFPLTLDTDNVLFDSITVPGCWQFQGYDKPFYVNTRYQFPYNPPEIPTTEAVDKVFCWMGNDVGIGPHWMKPKNEYNYVGVYRKCISIADISKHYTIAFMGVASCLDLYVNGEFVGYSEGAHNTAEFDLTRYLIEGDNELVGVVHRWCNGSYLECQDMFRNNGIFRDVLLYISEEDDVQDVAFSTEKKGGKYTAKIQVKTYNDTQVKVTLQGENVEAERTQNTENGKTEILFTDLEPTEWNAEYPTLYNLYIETPCGCIKNRVGFKKVAIEDTLFTINGSKVKLHGVNHHDTSATSGYTMTPELIMKDVQVCKEHNIDTIRTSHYPPDPFLIELCDEYGIYVVEEADIETHGVFCQKFPPNYNRISDDPSWKEHYVDRGIRMYERDKSHPSIIMWSLGNEAGGFACQDAMYDFFKKVTDIPVHYEGVIHSERKAYDVGSEMYPSVEKIRSIGEKSCKIKELNDRPYFMCEYAHAMGVGPGGIEDYWKEIYQFDNLMGGCIWEMIDHAVLEEDGSYTYGGDHGEWEHDGNFCVDGLFYPDRTPSTGAKLAAFTYRPMQVRHIKGDTFELFNTTAFSQGERFALHFQWNDQTEVLVTPRVGPLSKVTIDVASTAAKEVADDRTQTAKGQDRFVNVVCVDKVSGRQVSCEQIVLEEAFAQKPQTSVSFPEEFHMNPDGTFTLKVGDTMLTTGSPYTVLYRAKTDNDQGYMVSARMEPFYETTEKLVTMDYQTNRLVVVSEVRGKKCAFTCTDTYESTGEGIVVTSKLHCTKGKGNLPRFGKAFRLDASFHQVEYYGRNGESYKDMVNHTQIAVVKCQVKDMTEPNIRPQESGNRMDTRYAAISDGTNTVKFTAMNKAFELGVKPYSERELIQMKHQKDEITTGCYVTISDFMTGIGTASCGPAALPQYCYPMNRDYEMSFLISVEKQN